MNENAIIVIMVVWSFGIFVGFLLHLYAYGSTDKLAKLEADILKYYLNEGYKLAKDQIDIREQWMFKVEINSTCKSKSLNVLLKDTLGIRPVFSTSNETTKEMFDKAIDFFKIKDTKE